MRCRYRRYLPSRRFTKTKLIVIILLFAFTVLIHAIDMDGDCVIDTDSEECNIGKQLTYDRLPIIVTAVAADHFAELLGMIASIQEVIEPYYGALKIVIYDIGLLPNQQSLLQMRCANCDVRPFPFSNYHRHVMELKNYVYKPLILKEVMKQNDFIFYLDSSIRFTRGKLKSLQKLLCQSTVTDVLVSSDPKPVLERPGIQFIKKFTRNVLSVNMNYGKFYNVNMKWLVIRKSSFSMNQFIKPWRTCALRCHGKRYGTIDPCPFIGNKQNTKIPKDVNTCHDFQKGIIDFILTEKHEGCEDIFRFDIARYANIESIQMTH